MFMVKTGHRLEKIVTEKYLTENLHPGEIFLKKLFTIAD